MGTTDAAHQNDLLHRTQGTGASTRVPNRALDLLSRSITYSAILAKRNVIEVAKLRSNESPRLTNGPHLKSRRQRIGICAERRVVDTGCGMAETVQVRLTKNSKRSFSRLTRRRRYVFRSFGFPSFARNCSGPWICRREEIRLGLFGCQAASAGRDPAFSRSLSQRLTGPSRRLCACQC